MSSPSATVLCEGSLAPSSSASLAAPHLELILGELLPTYADLPPTSLSALSRTSKTLRTHLLHRVFRDLVVRRTLDERTSEEEGTEDGRRPSDEVRRAVRKLDWTLAAEENCVDDDEDDGDFERSQERMRSKVSRTSGEMTGLGKLLSSLPSLLSLSLTSQTYSPLPLLTLSASLLPQLSNLSSLNLTGFTIPDPTLLALLVATPHLLSLTLQTFAPSAASASSSSTSASSDPTPVPSAFPPNLPHSALRHLQDFTGLASHVGPLLKGGQRSLRRLEVEMCGLEGEWEELVRELEGLPCRAGKAGLRELKVTGVEPGGVEDGVEMVRKLGAVLSGKGALEVLEVGVLSGLGEQEGEVERFLTLALPHLPALASLRCLTLTTPEPTASTTSSAHHFTTSPTPTIPLPLLPLSKTLPYLATLTLNATLWRFLRPDVVSTSPTHARSSALYNPLQVPAALNGNKKLRKRTTSFLRECASGSRHAGVSSGSEEE